MYAGVKFRTLDGRGVAPAQHEMAPIFSTANIATDHNQLVMEVMKKVAKRREYMYAGVKFRTLDGRGNIPADNLLNNILQLLTKENGDNCRRGFVEAIPYLTADKTVAMFERQNVLTKTELESRVEINYEIYSKTINIEAKKVDCSLYFKE